MAAVLAAASYSMIGFSIYFPVRARRVRVPGGSKFHLEPGKIKLTVPRRPLPLGFSSMCQRYLYIFPVGCMCVQGLPSTRCLLYIIAFFCVLQGKSGLVLIPYSFSINLFLNL